MITYHDAINNLLSNAPILNDEFIDLDHSLGRVCSQTILSREELPSFANSAMDGFAVQAEITQRCSNLNPLHLPVADTIAAGDRLKKNVIPPIECAYEIMTGAPVPTEYNSVIPVESITFADNKQDGYRQIVVHEPTQPGRNIRYPGEDFRIGDVVISQGTVIAPSHIMALSSLGITQLNVFHQPKITILSTGNELVPIDTAHLEVGQIRHSNGIYLCNALRSQGISADFLGCFSDDPDILESQLYQLLNATDPPDIIITTGAVSAGKWDFIPTLVQKLKMEILFHKVAIRPGKPILAARWLDKSYFFGLPGNPISCTVGLRFFVYPLLRKLRAMTPEKPLTAKLTDAVTKKPGLHTFCKAIYESDDSGQLKVNLLKDQESFKIKPLLAMNCWAVLDGSRSDYQANDLINIYEAY